MRQSLAMFSLVFTILSGISFADGECIIDDKGGDVTYAPTPFVPQSIERAPTLVYDEAHHNIYTVNKTKSGLKGKFKAFAQLATAEGFSVRTQSSVVGDASDLRGANLYVIAGAAAHGNHKIPGTLIWDPTIGEPSFSSKEIDAIEDYVIGGGSLLLAVNHAPLSDPYRDLLYRFGIRIQDSSIFPLVAPSSSGAGWDLSVRSDHPIAQGVSSLRTGGGPAMSIFGPEIKSIVKYPFSLVAIGDNLPFSGSPTNWQTSFGSPNIIAIDFGSRKRGAGKIVVVAHAGDFTSQQEYCGGVPANTPPQQTLIANQKLVLNILRWLVKE